MGQATCGLRLPSDATHPILDVIAIGTQLTLVEMREEQCARQVRRAAPAANSGSRPIGKPCGRGDIGRACQGVRFQTAVDESPAAVHAIG
jgi:hypothetical protein